MKTMHVRDAVRDDLAAIVAIYNHAVATSTATFDLEPTTLEARRDWFEKFGAENPLWVAVVDGAVDGFAYYLPYRPKPGYRTTRECTVYIAPERQRRGVGAALYSELILRARAAGVHALIGVIGGDNPASVALHEKFGFREVGRLREVGNKFGQWVDTPIFELLLGRD